MTKTGRNDPCPCGSGKKYKQCCLKKDEAAEHEALAAAAAAKPPRPIAPKTMVYPDFDDEEDELTSASNAVVDLVHAGKLDEAEQGARDLLVRFPDVHDGYDRSGMVYEARSDNKQAADYIARPSRSFASVRISTMTRNPRPSSTGVSPSSTRKPPRVDTSI